MYNQLINVTFIDGAVSRCNVNDTEGPIIVYLHLLLVINQCICVLCIFMLLLEIFQCIFSVIHSGRMLTKVIFEGLSAAHVLPGNINLFRLSILLVYMSRQPIINYE